MNKIYLETSSLNQALSEGKSGAQVTELAAALDLCPAIGIHTIYELARTFLKPDQNARGRALFSLLRDIECTYIPMTGQLIESELIKLRTGAVVMPFLDQDNQMSTRYEIEALAQGFTERATQFIGEREQERKSIEPIENQNYLAHLRSLTTAGSKRFQGVSTFKKTLSTFNDDMPNCVVDVVKGLDSERVSRSEAAEIVMRFGSFPCIRSLVRANLYLNFIMIRNKVEPSYDRLDDFRQVADASYCQAFLTNDAQLARTSNNIDPSLQIIEWADFV